MTCHVEEVVFAGEKTAMFFCGDEDPRQPCATCAAPDAPWLCDWPVLRQVEIPIDEIKLGDVWITQQAGKRGRVVEVQDLDASYRTVFDNIEIGPPAQPANVEWFARRFWVLIPGHRKPYPYMRYWNGTVLTERAGGTCDAPCCDAHVREVDEQIHYCRAHWNSWEAA